MARYFYKIDDGEKQQLYIFNVTHTSESAILESIWLIVRYGDYETKIIMNIPSITKQISDGEATPFPAHAEAELIETFDDLVSDPDAEDHVLIIDHQFEVDPLLEAADKAAEEFNETFEDIIARKINEQKATKR